LNESIEKSKNGDYEDALEICESMLSIFPNAYEIYETRSEIYHKMGDYEGALSDLEHVIALMPNEVAPIFRRGRWKLELGHYLDAITDFSKVIDSNTSYFLDAAYYFRAEAFLYCHEYEKTLNDCQQVPDDFFIGPNKITKDELINRAKIGKKPGKDKGTLFNC
jgi:tetratricopeptide (TPR) repeat protein